MNKVILAIRAVNVLKDIYGSDIISYFRIEKGYAKLLV